MEELISMDWKLLFFVFAMFFSGILVLNVLNIVAGTLVVWFGLDYWVTIILLIIGLFVGAILFGFFLMPGGEWAWKQKKEE